MLSKTSCAPPSASTLTPTLTLTLAPTPTLTLTLTPTPILTLTLTLTLTPTLSLTRFEAALERLGELEYYQERRLRNLGLEPIETAEEHRRKAAVLLTPQLTTTLASWVGAGCSYHSGPRLHLPLTTTYYLHYPLLTSDLSFAQAEEL